MCVSFVLILQGNISQAENPNYGGLRVGVAWYRKSFTVDPAWKGQLVWLTFDGAFRACDVYLNGAFVGHHEEGYTSFNLYLHNATNPVKFGSDATNTLAVCVRLARPDQLLCRVRHP